MNERQHKVQEELNRQIDEQKKADRKFAMEAIAQSRRKPTKFEPSPMHFPAEPSVPGNEHAKKVIVEVVNTKVETPPFTLEVVNETKKNNVPILQAPDPISKPVPFKPVITVPEVQPSPKPVPAKTLLSGRWDVSQPGYYIGAPRRPTPEEDRQFEIDSIKAEIEGAHGEIEATRVRCQKKIAKLKRKLAKLQGA